MAHFNFTVDTNPMANSIDTVSHHVDRTTTAVVAMQSAVVIAEKNSADRISQNLNYGFYSLIRSQISQKIAHHKSKADAKIMELQQQSVSLLAIKNRMERDYMMLAARYTKLFESLNKELRIRIFELDKPTTSFVNRDITPVAMRTKLLSAIPAMIQLESITDSQKISISNTRNNALRNIVSMRDFISNSEEQKELIGSILVKGQIREVTNKCIPVVICESGGINVRQAQWQVNLPKLSSAGNSKMETHVYSELKALSWSPSSESNMNRVKSEVENLAFRTEMPVRVRNKMLSMVEGNAWQNLNVKS